jgi:hypothetical protein
LYHPAVRAVLACVLASAVLLGNNARQATAAREVHDLLKQLGLSDGDLSLLERGEPLARVLDTDRRQVGVAGAVRVRSSRDRLLARFRDLSYLARSDMVLALGEFSTPPSADDMRGLTFEEHDLNSVRDCEPGDCGVRLPQDSLAIMIRDVNWRGPAWRDEVTRNWKRALAAYAGAYAAGGDAALAEYRNREEPLKMQEEFAILRKDSATFDTAAPELMRVVRDYPRASAAAVEHILYWSKESFGLRPVVSVTHRIVHAPAGSTRAAVAAKQIYATHYFDAGLGFTLIVEDAGVTYLVQVNRIRTRSLNSIFRAMVRSTVQRRSREGVEKMLRGMKAAAEAGR